MINRAAVILRYKAPAIKWINDADPYEDHPGISSKSVNEDRTLYLISDHDGDSPSTLKTWIELNYEALFENELYDWYTDEKLWPKKRDLKLFYEWFEVECHTGILDTVESPIEDEEL